jgi:glyoxylase I family protein
MLKRIDHVEIIPRDFEKSLAFYTDVLGFTVDHRYPIQAPALTEVAYLTLNGSALELLKSNGTVPARGKGEQSGYRLMAWEVEDMDATLKALAAKGVAASWGPRKTDDYIRAEITDPEGNAIELRQWLQRPRTLR